MKRSPLSSVPCTSKRGHGVFAAGGVTHFVIVYTGAGLERPGPAMFAARERDLHNSADRLAVLNHRVVIAVAGLLGIDRAGGAEGQRHNQIVPCFASRAAIDPQTSATMRPMM